VTVNHRIAIVALAAGLALLVAMWTVPPPSPALTDRWVPLLKRNEAACSWVEDCRPS
jgi:hypothetical protein